MAIKYDLIIIGAGPGGYTAALKAAGFGMKVAVIERDKLGGVCINRGCIPTKALLHASSIFSMMQHSDVFGVSTDFISFDFGKMQDYKKRSVKRYRGEIEKLFEKNKIDYIKGTATIRRGKTVEVNSENGKEFFQADRIIIVERGPHLLSPMDGEVAAALKQQLTEKGITIYCNSVVEEITEEEGLNCHIRNLETEEVHTTKATQVVSAIGRVPYIDGLFGEDVTLKMEEGRIRVNEDFETSEPGIYAIGDVVASTQLAHVAMAQATYVIENIAGQAHSIRLKAVPSGMYVSLPIVPNCIYTEPEIATVGITEQKARELGMPVRCGVYRMDGNGKSIIAREENGFIRLIFEAYNNTIVGAQIICPRATDMIGEMTTAIANGLTAKQLSMAMRAHPTYSEGIGAAIEDAMR